MSLGTVQVRAQQGCQRRSWVLFPACARIAPTGRGPPPRREDVFQRFSLGLPDTSETISGSRTRAVAVRSVSLGRFSAPAMTVRDDRPSYSAGNCIAPSRSSSSPATMPVVIYPSTLRTPKFGGAVARRSAASRPSKWSGTRAKLPVREGAGGSCDCEPECGVDLRFSAREPAVGDLSRCDPASIQSALNVSFLLQ